jgi:hypothetical protein
MGSVDRMVVLFTNQAQAKPNDPIRKITKAKRAEGVAQMV